MSTKIDAKYELTGEKRVDQGVVLHRIVAITAFGTVKPGDLGGFVESEENLSHTGNAWIGYHAQVYGNARVYGNASVCGNAKVSGCAKVYGNARVYGNASVYDIAKVFGYANVYGNARVYGNASVYHNARVSDYAKVYGSAVVYGNASVFDNAKAFGGAQVYGNAVLAGEAVATDRVLNIVYDKYDITATDSHLKIGCQQHTIAEWSNFDDNTIRDMDDGALVWWKKWKPIIFAILA